MKRFISTLLLAGIAAVLAFGKPPAMTSISGTTNPSGYIPYRTTAGYADSPFHVDTDDNGTWHTLHSNCSLQFLGCDQEGYYVYRMNP